MNIFKSGVFLGLATGVILKASGKRPSRKTEVQSGTHIGIKWRVMRQHGKYYPEAYDATKGWFGIGYGLKFDTADEAKKRAIMSIEEAAQAG